jgi:hypothetical protein
MEHSTFLVDRTLLLRPYLLKNNYYYYFAAAKSATVFVISPVLCHEKNVSWKEEV